MKVYISCHHPDPANELAAALRAAGHDVVSTWHTDAPPKPPLDNATAWAAKAAANLEIIDVDAEALVLIAGPEKYSGGKFIEAGYAMTVGCDVYTLGRVENGMLHHPKVKHAADVGELLALI